MTPTILADELAGDMAALYIHIYRDDSLAKIKKYGQTQTRPHVDYRHIVRTLVRRKRDATLIMLARAEAQLFGHKPSHSALCNSRAKFDGILSTRYPRLIHHLTLFYDARIKDQEPEVECNCK